MPARRRPAKHPPVVQQTPIVQALLDTIDGYKETEICTQAGTTRSYISQLRYGRIVDPGVNVLSRLGATLGYELRWVKCQS